MHLSLDLNLIPSLHAPPEIPCNSPFRYASGGFSLPLEKYVKRVHNDTLAYASVLGDDDKSFIPAHLEPPPTDVLLLHQKLK